VEVVTPQQSEKAFKEISSSHEQTRTPGSKFRQVIESVLVSETKPMMKDY